MHILLLDERLADRPCPSLAALAALLAGDGVRVSLCSPTLTAPVSGPLAGEQGWPIRLDTLPNHHLAGDWSGFTSAISHGQHSFSAAAATLAETPLGLLRELIRRAVTHAVDQTDVDVIFVCQAGILVEFAIETGPPVAAHADARDLAALASAGRLKDIVAAALSSCDFLAADTANTAELLGTSWIETDPERPIETWDLTAGLAAPPTTCIAENVLAACRTAMDRRFTP